MPRDENIFYNVVRGENSLSELLSNLLQFSTFNTLFSNLLETKLGFPLVFGYEDVRTQVSLGSKGIPDISIITDESVVLIESKIDSNTSLTANQPQSYLEYLRSEKNFTYRGLVFLFPSDYLHKNELQRRVNCFSHTKGSNEVAFATLQWEEINQALVESGLPELNPIFDHLSSLLTSWFSTKTITFKGREIQMLYNKEIPALYLKMTDLITQVKHKLSKSYKVAGEINNYGHGIYVKDKDGSPIIWFGIWYQYWKESGFPLCVAVLEQWRPSIVKRFRNKFGKEVLLFDEENWYIHGFAQDFLSNSDSVKTLIQELTRLIIYLKK